MASEIFGRCTANSIERIRAILELVCSPSYCAPLITETSVVIVVSLEHSCKPCGNSWAVSPASSSSSCHHQGATGKEVSAASSPELVRMIIPTCASMHVSVGEDELETVELEDVTCFPAKVFLLS